MKTKTLYSLAFAALLTFSGTALATPYGFTVVEDNSTIDPTSQFSVDVTNGGSGITAFTFTNTGDIDTFISNISFDFGTSPELTFKSFIPIGDVSYIINKNDKNLPGGNTISFFSDWTAEPNSPGTDKDGIDNWTTDDAANGVIQDSLSITFAGSTYANIVSALNSDILRIGIHVQGLPDGKSESYVTGGSTPIPEPATILLFSSGIAGLAGISRRKRKKA